MYKKEPWTLKEEKRRKADKNASAGNTVSAVIALLTSNKNKDFSLNEITKLTNRQKAVTSMALAHLYQNKSIKIVKFSLANNSILTPHYQIITGRDKEITVIRDDSDTWKKLGLETIPTFIRTNHIQSSIKFRYFVESQGIPKYFAKTHASFCYAYRKKDLLRAFKSFKKGQVKNKDISFNINLFNIELVITIHKK